MATGSDQESDTDCSTVHTFGQRRGFRRFMSITVERAATVLTWVGDRALPPLLWSNKNSSNAIFISFLRRRRQRSYEIRRMMYDIRHTASRLDPTVEGIAATNPRTTDNSSSQSHSYLTHSRVKSTGDVLGSGNHRTLSILSSSHADLKRNSSRKCSSYNPPTRVSGRSRAPPPEGVGRLCCVLTAGMQCACTGVGRRKPIALQAVNSHSHKPSDSKVVPAPQPSPLMAPSPAGESNPCTSISRMA